VRTVVETAGLTRHFGTVRAIDSLDLHVSAGSVYGFLGPNGAGKTTTIRMLLGLIRPDCGTVRLFERPFHRGSLARVGALVESPALHRHLTGRENLEVVRRMTGRRLSDVDRALDIVRLGDAAERRVAGSSLGTRQRLGLALALLGAPELLILDEPTNGLDPAGIREVRELLSRLASEQGITVFFSSHLLSEVAQVATHAGIVNRGRLVFQCALAELRERMRPQLEIGTDRPEEAARSLAAASFRVARWNGQGVLVEAAHEAAAARQRGAGDPRVRRTPPADARRQPRRHLPGADMQDFLRASWAEALKLKGTLALWAAVLAPLVMVLLQTMYIVRTRHLDQPLWPRIEQSTLGWGILLLPLTAALLAALLAGVEHREDNWKLLFALPVSRYAVYWAKITAAEMLLALSHAVLWAGLLTAGMLLHLALPSVPYSAPPWMALAGRLGGMWAASGLLISIQMWVSFRAKSFTVPIGLAIAAVAVSVMGAREWSMVAWPWMFPGNVTAVERRTAALIAGALGGLIVAMAGARDVARRDVL
jgi:ABC-type multidrug transport system ATPase subunit